MLIQVQVQEGIHGIFTFLSETYSSNINCIMCEIHNLAFGFAVSRVKKLNLTIQASATLPLVFLHRIH